LRTTCQLRICGDRPLDRWRTVRNTTLTSTVPVSERDTNVAVVPGSAGRDDVGASRCEVSNSCSRTAGSGWQRSSVPVRSMWLTNSRRLRPARSSDSCFAPKQSTEQPARRRSCPAPWPIRASFTHRGQRGFLRIVPEGPARRVHQRHCRSARQTGEWRDFRPPHHRRTA